MIIKMHETGSSSLTLLLTHHPQRIYA